MTAPEPSRPGGLGRKILLGALFLILAATFLFGQRGLLRWNQLRRQCEAMRSKNDSLEQEIAVLTERIQALEVADSLELERVARFWGMVRPGEEIYIIREEGDSLAGEERLVRGKH